ncbi:tetratricopeptide repeat protein [Vibrio methylphosphonaticus]|uniref:tetratricopeptide repeat protein n=1 Tax=Vibrio methylphosphonaticus TaxID=2946866 RepID=UPI00202A71ED|nr:tetratricopeptide repeat protein [Vibrio methylphosphonaticus]MCL9777577.1 tetratricopeptide repeat protein [Vibrio methylphosphonaticus]
MTDTPKHTVTPKNFDSPVLVVATWEKVAGYLFGTIFIATILTLAVVIEIPNSFQWSVFKTILALAAAGVGGVFTGFLQVQGSIQKVKLQAGGALALFVIVYFFSPATPPVDYLPQKTEQQYQQELTERKKKIEVLLIKSELSERDKLDSEAELKAIQSAIADVNLSYSVYIKELTDRIRRLDKIANQLPTSLLIDAKAALAKGDKSLADKVFAQIEEQSESHINAAAEAAYQRGSIASANIELRNALNHFTRAVQLSPDNTTYLYALAGAYMSLGETGKAITYYEMILNNNRDDNDGNLIDVAIIHNSLGLAWYNKGEYDEAIRHYELALNSNLNTYGKIHPSVARDLSGLGSVWSSKGEVDKAIGYYEQALTINLENYGKGHPELARNYNGLGINWSAKGQYDKAIKYYEQALIIDRSNFGDNHPKVITRRHNIGRAWFDKGEYDKAIDYYEQALSSSIQIYGEINAHPHIASLWQSLGLAWHAKGQLDHALDYYKQALAGDLKIYGDAHPSVATTRFYIGALFESIGEIDTAINYYEQVLESDLKIFGEGHPNVASDRYNLGRAWEIKGEYNKAIDYYELVLASDIDTYGEGDPIFEQVSASLIRVRSKIKDTNVLGD